MKTNGHMKTNSININATRAKGKESGRNWKHNPPYYSAPGNQMQQFFEIIAQKSHLE